jgi:flavin reductase (DIM6/NTAB) family NADH-FMN oxidoreductase RutF
LSLLAFYEMKDPNRAHRGSISLTMSTVSQVRSPPSLPTDRLQFRYTWPDRGALDPAVWRPSHDGTHHFRAMPESRAELERDSRWPGFFPSPICITTTSSGGVAHVEKVVGASIVNRFPYVVALSYCREQLSSRHYARHTFMDALEASGRVALQFLMPGEPLHALMSAIAQIPENEPAARFAAAGLSTHGSIPVFDDAYLVYHCRLAKPGHDFDGMPIYKEPFIDVGSHRVYFLEIESIALDESIAHGRAPLHWRSLPVWRGAPQARVDAGKAERRDETLARSNFVKAYQPDYVFPSAGTIAFAADEQTNGLSIKHLPPLPADQVEVDNDRARWPCFFPSSLGLITIEDNAGRVGGMACGSTTILSRHPLTLAICVSYARINERYAPRASLELLEQADHFGCGVPHYDANVLEAIRYLGNVTRSCDPQKVDNCGLTPVRLGKTFGFAELPVHYDCRIVARQRLGTHMLILGEVENVFVRNDVSAENPLEWCPWAGSTRP